MENLKNSQGLIEPEKNVNKEVSNHIKGWINYLSDTRMCHMKHFIHPVRELIKDESISSNEKIEKIKIIIDGHLLEHHKINPKDYGVNIP
jgi:hypothetical protein